MALLALTARGRAASLPLPPRAGRNQKRYLPSFPYSQGGTGRAPMPIVPLVPIASAAGRVASRFLTGNNGGTAAGLVRAGR